MTPLARDMAKWLAYVDWSTYKLLPFDKHIIREWNTFCMVAFLGELSAEDAIILIACGWASVNARGSLGITALHRLIHSTATTNTDVIAVLLAMGTDPNIPGHSDGSLLHTVIASGTFEDFRLILQAGCEINNAHTDYLQRVYGKSIINVIWEARDWKRKLQYILSLSDFVLEPGYLPVRGRYAAWHEIVLPQIVRRQRWSTLRVLWLLCITNATYTTVVHGVNDAHKSTNAFTRACASRTSAKYEGSFRA
jgi:hypothetical protein